MSRRPAAARAVVVAIALAVGGCGIPTDSGPRVVRDKDVPFSLLDTSTTEVPASGPPSAVTSTTARP